MSLKFLCVHFIESRILSSHKRKIILMNENHGDWNFSMRDRRREQICRRHAFALSFLIMKRFFHRFIDVIQFLRYLILITDRIVLRAWNAFLLSIICSLYSLGCHQHRLTHLNSSIILRNVKLRILLLLCHM